jgi:hypothetical protein
VPNTSISASAPNRIRRFQKTCPLGRDRARLRGLAHWVAENAKTTRAFLKRVDAIVPLAQPLQAVQIVELPRPTKRRETDRHRRPTLMRSVAPALQGFDIGLISEAGLPAVAGSRELHWWHAAHRRGVKVVAHVRAQFAHAAHWRPAGLNGQSFAFVGYLPGRRGRAWRHVSGTLEGLVAAGTSRRSWSSKRLIETRPCSDALPGGARARNPLVRELRTHPALGLDSDRHGSLAGKAAPLQSRRMCPPYSAYWPESADSVFLAPNSAATLRLGFDVG